MFRFKPLKAEINSRLRRRQLLVKQRRCRNSTNWQKKIRHSRHSVFINLWYPVLAIRIGNWRTSGFPKGQCFRYSCKHRLMRSQRDRQKSILKRFLSGILWPRPPTQDPFGEFSLQRPIRTHSNSSEQKGITKDFASQNFNTTTMKKAPL